MQTYRYVKHTAERTINNTTFYLLSFPSGTTSSAEAVLTILVIIIIIIITISPDLVAHSINSRFNCTLLYLLTAPHWSMENS